MIIGVKYWNRGASAPGTWTDLHVAECEASVDTYPYDSGEALDGTEFNYKRNKYEVRLLVDPFSFNDSTFGAVVTALRKADFMRVKDVRYSWLGDANTIDHNVQGSKESREEPTLLSRRVEITGRAVITHT